MFSKTFLVVTIVAIGGSYGVSEEDKNAIREKVLPIVAECAQEYGLTLDSLKATKAAGDFSSVDPCFMACTLKKSKLLTEDGKIDQAVMADLAKTFLTKPEDMEVFEKVSEKCAPVNDAPVTDGNKGCERAKLLLDCVIENKGIIPTFN